LAIAADEPFEMGIKLLENNPKLPWLYEKLTALAGQKALLICKQAQMALDLSQAIKQKTGQVIPVFHEAMSIVERDRAAAWFADTENEVPLLICSEIGSEGRNFQFVHHLILFDLPNNPDLLQQRIGRLDRIGQKHIIEIHIPYLKATAEGILFRWYDQGLNAFRRNCSAAHQVYEQQYQELQQLFESNASDAVDAFIDTTVQLRKQLDLELHQRRDHLLELNSCRTEEAQQLINLLEALDQHETLWEYFEQIADCYGVETEFHSSDCYILTPGNHMRIANFPELPLDGITITTRRNIALAREDMQFLTWEHPLMTAAMDLVINSDTGNAAVSIVKHTQLEAGQFMLEILFVVECSAPAWLQIGRFLPPTPLRLLIDEKQQDLSALISHQSFIETVESFEKHQVVEFLSTQKEQLNAMLAMAEKSAEQQMQKLIHQSNLLMLDSLGHEMKRLIRLKNVNPNIKQQEVDQLKDKIKLAHASISAAKLKLDAVRFLIIG
jgi:ATP-dependent helicase HepA